MPRDRRDDWDDEDERPRRRRRRDEDDDRREYDDEDDDRPRRRQSEPPTNGPATVSLVLGIISLAGGITAIPGLICGVAGLNKAKKLGGAGKGMAVTGTVLSGVGVIVLGLTVWLVVWWLGGREDTRGRMMASNNLKQVGLAMHNSHDVNGQFSTGIVTGPQDFAGRPLRESEVSSRLSWRVGLLPYLEQDFVFRQMNLDEPWDSAANRRHSDIAISQYSDPDARADPATRWRTFAGRGAPFDPAFPRQRVTIAGITDGTSNTIFVAESGEKVTWTRFGEIRFDPSNPPNPQTFGREKASTFQVLLFDGSVKNLRKTMNSTTFGHAITHNGGEVMGPDFDR